MFVPFTVSDFIDRATQVYGGRVGVIDEPVQPASSQGALTYTQMGDLARRQAAKLDELGIEVGERVAFLSQNSSRLMTSFFGVSGWGRVLVPVNFRLSPDEVQFVVQHSGARALYIDPDLEDSMAGVVCEHKFVLGDDDSLYASAGAEPQPWVPDETATATINYTSGTTARPKGVRLTHRNVWVNAVILGMHTQINDRDVYLHTLPQFHANGWGMPFAVTGVGGQHVILRKVDGAEILRRVRDYGVTVMCGAPAVANAVLDAMDGWKEEIPGRHRLRFINGGAPPPSKTIMRIEQELGWEFIQLYGLTESSPVLTINRTRAEWDAMSAAERASRLTRAGTPVLGVRLDIDQSDEGAGEVLARSNSVFDGYWEQPEESEKVLTGGWFRTGDGGRIGADGYLTIADRKKDVIITGGENVSSIEVEDCLYSHPAVAEVAVIGVPSEKWGETVKALVVLADGHQPDGLEAELIRWCKDRLASYKSPTSVEFREELTRTATGKLQKFKLREPYWADSRRSSL